LLGRDWRRDGFFVSVSLSLLDRKRHHQT